MADRAYYEEIEGRLRALLIEHEEVFAGGVEEVADYLDANELGLALETMLDIAIEEERPVPPGLADGLRRVADRMGVGDELADRFDALAIA
ncbi:MAG TPA: hypothetical protein VHN98_02270 [Acidimicrobiales bacterium]|nr:hypothetical protein [Acidimicrobiales bacterium]